MTSKKAQDNLIARKKALAEKYSHLSTITTSRPRQANYRRKAAFYAQHAEQLQRQAKK